MEPITVLKLSMEVTQEVIPSFDADLISIQNPEERKKSRRQGRVKPYDQVAKLTHHFKAVLQEMKAECRKINTTELTWEKPDWKPAKPKHLKR